MKTKSKLGTGRIAAGALAFTVIGLVGAPLLAQAQPGDDCGAPVKDRGERPPPPDRAPPPFMAVLDTDEDGVLSAAEIAAAPTVLAAWDANADGEVDGDEVREALPPPPRRHAGRGRPEGRRGPPPPPDAE